MKIIQKHFLLIAIVLGFIFPLVSTLKDVLSGSMAFWYDPARDMLLALANLSKISLIGPPAGIPGIFYGPYWIWLLSVGLLFSKDPRIVTLLTETIPYFTLFPFLLFQFRKILGLPILLLIWLLFIFNYNNYATQLWNPHLAPLLFLTVIYFVTFTDFYKSGPKTYLKTLILGMVTALTLNFHISFGLGLTLGVSVFLIFDTIMDIYTKRATGRKAVMHRIAVMVLYALGFVTIFLPFFIFEYRHGFQQIQVIIKTITSPVPVVGQQGLNKLEIIQQFFGRLHETFYIPQHIMTIFGMGVFVYLLSFLYRKKFSVKEQLVKLIFLLIIVSCTVLSLYLSSKNPVWNYHFIGVEIIFLFFVGFFAKTYSLFAKLLAGFVALVFFLHMLSFVNSFSQNPQRLTSLATKEFIVNTILTDAKNTTYSIFIYNPAIYNYDYAYLFQTKGKDVPYDPGLIARNGDIIYLILPKASQKEKENFIHYQTPDTLYKTDRIWHIADGSIIMKRVKK